MSHDNDELADAIKQLAERVDALEWRETHPLQLVNDYADAVVITIERGES